MLKMGFLFYFGYIPSTLMYAVQHISNIPTIIFFEKNYVFITLKINTMLKAFLANQFILSITFCVPLPSDKSDKVVSWYDFLFYNFFVLIQI